MQAQSKPAGVENVVHSPSTCKNTSEQCSLKQDLSGFAGTKEKPNVVVTNHARQRMQERCGSENPIVKELLQSHSNCERIAEIVLRKGAILKECSAALRERASMLYLKPKQEKDVRIFGEYAYVFSKNNLVTVITLPNIYNDAIRKMLRSDCTQNEHPPQKEGRSMLEKLRITADFATIGMGVILLLSYLNPSGTEGGFFFPGLILFLIGATTRLILRFTE